MSSRKPTRAAIRASSEGTARPVTVVEKMTSTSSAAMPAAASAPLTAWTAELDGGLDVGVVGRGEVGEQLVVVERQREIPAADPGIGVDAAEHLMAGTAVAVSGAEDVLGEGLGDLVLRVSVGGKDRVHGGKAGHAGDSTFAIAPIGGTRRDPPSHVSVRPMG